MIESDHSPSCMHVFISGRVQGVGYRYNTYRQARQLNIKGWVQNLKDGRVEAWFEGEPDAIERMLRWCQGGPLSAKVEAVSAQTASAEGFEEFKIRR
jgi:acylphosphatase